MFGEAQLSSNLRVRESEGVRYRIRYAELNDADIRCLRKTKTFCPEGKAVFGKRRRRGQSGKLRRQWRKKNEAASIGCQKVAEALI